MGRAKSLKQVVLCSGGLPGAGATLLACLLAVTLLPQAARIRLDGPSRPSCSTPVVQQGGQQSKVSTPDACFGADFQLDATDAIHRVRLAELLQGSADNARFVVDLSSGDPEFLAHPPLAYALDAVTLFQGMLIEVVMIVQPDNQAMRRARGAIDAIWKMARQHIRVTVVFNQPDGRSGVGQDGGWERMWRDWPHRTHMLEQGRLIEVRMPFIPRPLIDQYLVHRDAYHDHEIAAPSLRSISHIDDARWRKVLQSIDRRFGHLIVS